jgi:acyl dehydratase
MPVTADAVGTKFAPMTHSWDERDVMLYALGVGAGTGELEYTYENAGLRTLPTFGVIPAFPALMGMGSVMSFNPMMLLHGEQKLVLHKPIPTSGSVSTEAEVRHVWDKGKGAVVVVEATSTDKGGEPLFTNTFTTFIRGEGGFGGDRGPSGPKNEAPDREADVTVELPTTPDQALLYRLSGDRNPLHADPNMAAMGGFDKPILHGLCTFGIVGRSIMNEFCDRDPSRFKSYEARFAGVVFPGETIVATYWKEGSQVFVRATTKERREPVLEQAFVEVS